MLYFSVLPEPNSVTVDTPLAKNVWTCVPAESQERGVIAAEFPGVLVASQVPLTTQSARSP